MGTRYRATGADLPFGRLLPAHGVRMEGYFWRFTQPGARQVVIALNGVNRAVDGAWATVGLADLRGGFLRTVAHPQGHADPWTLGSIAGEAFQGDAHHLKVDLGADARLDVRITDQMWWPRRMFGGSSYFQMIPALNQYWHPWLLGGRAEGTASLGGQVWDLTGAQVYAEKNWGRGGFPDAWWWGQAHGFAEPQACVAFAGGIVTAGPLRTEVTAVVVLMPDGTLIRLGNPGTSPVRADVSDGRWLLQGRSLGWSVDVAAEAPPGDSHVLPVPLPLERRNVAGALEHLGGTLQIEVRRRGRLRWSGHSTLAGLERGGLAQAAAELERRGAPPDAVDSPPERRGVFGG